MQLANKLPARVRDVKCCSKGISIANRIIEMYKTDKTCKTDDTKRIVPSHMTSRRDLIGELWA